MPISTQPDGALRILGSNVVSDTAFSPDGTYLYTASGSSITVYSTATGNFLASWGLGGPIGAIDISADGRYIVALGTAAVSTSGDQWSRTADYNVYRLDTVTGATETFVNHATGYDGAFYDVSYLANGTVLMSQNFLGSGWEPLTTLDFSTGVFTRGTATYAQDGTLNSTPDDRYVAFSPHNISDAPVYVYTSGTGVTASHGLYADDVSGFNSGVQAISPDGNLVFEGVGLNVYNRSLVRQVSLITLYPEIGGVIGAAFSSDGTKLYLLRPEGTILALSTADWSLSGSYSTSVTLSSYGYSGYGNELATSPDGHYLSVIGASGVQLVDLTKIVSSPGTSGDDVIADVTSPFVYGFAGNDTISVTGVTSFVRAGSGNDLINFTWNGAGSGYYYSTSLIDGGSGDDTLNLSGAPGAQIQVAAGGFTITLGSGYYGNVYTVTGIEHLQLGSANDTVAFPSSDMSTFELRGGAGNDTLQGGPNMVLRGDEGDDVFSITSRTGAATSGVIDGGAGNDTLYAATGFTIDLAAHTAQGGSASYIVTGIENVVVTTAGSASTVSGDDNANTLSVNAYRDDGTVGVIFDGRGGNDVLNGGAGNDQLTGGAGDDILHGGAGADTMVGGTGNDIYDVDNAGDIVTEVADQGIDEVRATIDYTLPSNVENLNMSGGTQVNGTGNALNNVITGNAQNNVLTGGLGDDTYVVDNVGDVIRELAGEGNDTIQASVSYALSANVENLVLTGTANINATGNTGNNMLTGNAGANVLDGGTGADSMAGGQGNDTYVVDNAGDVVVERPGEGTDLVQSSISYQLTANVEQLTLTGSLAAYGTGNELDNVLIGNAQNNVLSGQQGNDRLEGGEGNDTLIGGAGSDTLNGGSGFDTAIYSGLFRSYAVQYQSGSGTVAGGPETGTDALTGIERVQFQDGTLIFDPDGIAAEITRLYDTVLHRQPDALGLDQWVDAVEDHGTTFKQVAAAFLASAEFQARTGSLSNADYVEFLYQSALGRPSDAAGKSYWVGQLQAGADRADLLIGFSESQEHRALTADIVNKGYFNTDDTYQAVALLYDGFANRHPDASGLIYWSEAIHSGTLSLQQVANGFAASPEFSGLTASLSNSQMVEYMYHNTLDRGSDTAGHDYWTARLDAGMSRGDLLLAFSESQEHMVLLGADITNGISII
ncbi:DUF4214 domain-containing protein [Sphingomonas sp. KRR8]|uniref:DUF4214 domain-containing protein n=1 Tax=Sphingomonas sp. KRR8 TaxID=2942996 RepID=UPI0020229331|nr:DUF4214 domain-containing protein [Sphingomonas sp. KRR8]URD62167.1 DUF4214 domain-containing protein [Sphingomonas sp. KRR8]